MSRVDGDGAHAPRISFFESASIFMKFYEMYDLFEFVLHLCFISGEDHLSIFIPTWKVDHNSPIQK